MSDYEIDLKQASFLDYYVTQYWWAAKQAKLNHELISAYFTIVYQLMYNLKEKAMSFSDNLLALEVMLVEANDSKVFSDEILKQVLTHIERTFFQNYRLYQYVCTQTQNEIVIPKEIEIECPKPVEQNMPGPLDEAMPDKMYSKYILKIDDEFKKAKTGTVQEEDEDNDFEITNEVIEEIHKKFTGVAIDDAKKIILEITTELVTDLKVTYYTLITLCMTVALTTINYILFIILKSDMRNKIKEREQALISELEKGSNQKNSRKK